MLSTGTILDWVAIIGMVVVGGFSLYGLLDREKRKREDDADKADDRLIKLLQGTVTSLDKQVKELTNQVIDLGNKVKMLQTENELLRGILQGRDGSTKKYNEIIQENNRLVKENGQYIRQTNTNMTNLLGLMEKHMKAVQTIMEQK